MSKYLDQDGVLYFWQKLKTLLGGKVDKVSGKGLSTNDYTTTEKNKLAGIADSANNYTLPTASSSTKGGVKIGDGLSIDSEGVLSAGAYALPTASSSTKGGVKIGSGLTMTGEVLSADTQTDNNFTTALKNKLTALPTATDLNATLNGKASTDAATQSANGLMSSSDKAKLDAFGAASTYALKTDISAMYKHKGSVSTTNDLPSTGNTEGDVYNVTATGMNYVWVVTSGTGAWDALGEVFTIDSITNSEIDTILAS